MIFRCAGFPFEVTLYNTRLQLLIENMSVKSTHPLGSIEKRREQALDAHI